MIMLVCCSQGLASMWEGGCGVQGSCPGPSCSVRCVVGATGGVYAPHHPSPENLTFFLPFFKKFCFFIVKENLQHKQLHKLLLESKHSCSHSLDLCKSFYSPFPRSKDYPHFHGNCFFVPYSFTTHICIPIQCGLILPAFKFIEVKSGYLFLQSKFPKP